MNAGGDPLGVQTITKISASSYSNNYTAKSPKGTLVFRIVCTRKP
jgi:hypothetical protein